jgi:CHAT domain-containing protein
VAERLTATLFPEGWETTPERIEVIADGALWELPMETLVLQRGPKPTYLDDRRCLSYRTPVSLSRDSQKPASDSPERSPKGEGAFFLDPEMPRPGLEPIKAGADVRSALQANVKVENRCFHMGEGARENAIFTRDVQECRWLHFTTHSDTENDWEQHLVLALAPGEAARKARLIPDDGNIDFPTWDRAVDPRDDGYLAPREIETLDLRAELVFLHGCHTLQGRTSFSGGLSGLLSAFISAGAHSIIASHWRISTHPSISTAIGQFYGRMYNEQQSAEDSLWQLRRQLRSGGGVGARTYGWAGFSIYY